MKTELAGQYLTFKIADQSYGLRITSVREINSATGISPVPGSPQYVIGVLNLRGKILPVFDLRVRLGHPSQEMTRLSCIIVVDTEKGDTGFLVDAVNTVVEIHAEQIESSSEGSVPYLGIAKMRDEIVLLIDHDKIFHRSEGELSEEFQKKAA